MAHSHSSTAVDESLIPTQTILRPYQVKGVEWLRAKKRAMLTDVQGLGKTLQAIHAADLPVLVACPTYLIEQWRDVLERERPGDTISAALGERAKRTAALAARSQWTIINHAMFRNYTFPTNYYKTLIVDESHWLRGRTALQSRSAAKLAKSIPRVYLLTGTPIMREVDDWWMQLYIIEPKTFSSYWDFVSKFCKTLTDMYSTRVVGPKNTLLLKMMLAKYALGRNYKEVGLYLPPLIQRDIPLRWNSAKQKEYQTVKKTYRTRDITLNSAIAMITELRRMTVCKEKIDACSDLLQDIPPGAGIVMYCWYRDTAQALADAFGWPIIDGSVEPNQRVVVAKENENVIATLASLSEGVDLSEKKHVVFFEVDYTPGNLEQSLSRLQRWTDKENAHDPVNAYYIYLKGTIDETILQCVRRRIVDARKILSRELA